jgi:predicted DNA-binding protein YlxM (UPF0122 family)
MGLTKIDDKKLLKLIDDQKLSKAEAARRLGVSRQAVYDRLKKIKKQTTKAIVAKPVSDVIDKKIQTMDQLNKINEYANELLDCLMAWQRGDDEALQVLESSMVERKVKMGDEVHTIREWKLKDPRELALRAMAEIRQQISLQFDMFQTIYSLQAAEEFQKIVLEAIGRVAPDVREEIITELHRTRTIRQAVTFS